MKNLIIVESPAKARTIEHYLGKDFQVMASFGHIRDLPKKELGIDVEKGFQPHYVLISRTAKTITALQKAITESEQVFLATDYDREGEAIAWHVAQACGLSNEGKKQKTKGKIVKRITFTEITKSALEEAVKNPRDINLNLVDAQQARRILDRLVGYKLSPFLWVKVMRGLSAGRVQSVAVRLIVEREEEIRKFQPEEYWEILAFLARDKSNQFRAKLTEIDGKKLDQLDIKDEKTAKKIIGELEKAVYQIAGIEEKSTLRFPSPPFTTSTLQQTANALHNFTAKKIMKLAQDLYEQGLITYMRTDSTNLATTAIDSIRKYVRDNIGQDYLPDAATVYTTKTKGAQEAHEAIRPTTIATANCQLSTDHQKLYELIWKRAVACQIKPAVIDATKVDIKAGKYHLVAGGQKINFLGFLKIWPTKIEEITLPPLAIDDQLTLQELQPKQSFTQPPRRYTEATLIKELEKKGIGRPSTYAPIISTIQDRRYVVLDRKYFHPQEIGEIVNKILVANFPEIVDLEFTAKMEDDLDEIAAGRKNWQKLITEFYQPFSENLNKRYQVVKKEDLAEKDQRLAIGKKCPQCHRDLKVKVGRFGKFLACSGFPECKYTEQLIIKVGKKCPQCHEGEMIERHTKKGKKFFGCSRWPKCQWASWKLPEVS